MTAITINRATVEQALEALKRADKISGYANNKKVITALRAALAQQAEPVAAERERCAEYLMQQAAECREDSPTRVTLESCAAVLRLGLHAQAEPVEPVAYRHLHEDGWEYHDAPTGEDCAECQALYTAPPKLVPLTEEEIVRIRMSLPHFVPSPDQHPYEWAVRYTRAVERALEEKNRGR